MTFSLPAGYGESGAILVSSRAQTDRQIIWFCEGCWDRGLCWFMYRVSDIPASTVRASSRLRCCFHCTYSCYSSHLMQFLQDHRNLPLQSCWNHCRLVVGQIDDSHHARHTACDTLVHCKQESAYYSLSISRRKEAKGFLCGSTAVRWDSHPSKLYPVPLPHQRAAVLSHCRCSSSPAAPRCWLPRSRHPRE